MLSEFKKSIQSIMYERLSNPFSGALLFSWVVWNWKAIFYLLFSTDNVIFRIMYIEREYVNWWNNLIFPIATTIFFIGLYPYITTYAYQVWLRHKKRQNDIKNKIQNNQLLTLEQSIALRSQLDNTVKEYRRLINDAETEKASLKKQIQDRDKTSDKSLENLKRENRLLEKKNNDIVKNIDRLMQDVKNEIFQLIKSIPHDKKIKLEDLDIVEKYIRNVKNILSENAKDLNNPVSLDNSKELIGIDGNI